MNLKKTYDVYNIIKNRLPSTYPRPTLIFFEDEHCMIKYNKIRVKEDESVYAIVDPETYTISLPLKMTFEYVKPNGDKYFNVVPINKVSEIEIAQVILHEIGHLYGGEKYGFDSSQYFSEQYCDRFANRWVKILVKEKLL
jgi:hypothetical protein